MSKVRLDPRMQRAVEERPGEAKDRNCLRCGVKFRSPSFGVRMCDKCCKEISNGSPYEP